MTPYISTALRRLVTDRAQGKCEYCLIHQDFSIYTHEIDHVVAVKHGGETIAENLVLSCLPCNRYKGSDLTSIDPVTGQIAPLFNPRLHHWAEHFQIENSYFLGRTSSGRTTVFLLKLNEPIRLQIRKALIAQALY
jgi:HNH endonuclease